MSMNERTLDKPESWGWHLIGFLLPAVAIAGNLLGEWWGLAPVVLVLGIYPVLDWLFGEDRRHRERRKNGGPLEAMLVVHALLVIPLVGTLCWRAMQDGGAASTWMAAFGCGIATGVSGIVIGHELGHRKRGSIRWLLGRFSLLMVLYLHFTTEHNLHHHRLVATRKDPASAPKGRGLWMHVVLTIPRQFASAWSIQARRSRSVLRNTILHGLCMQAALCAAIWFVFGVWGLAAFLFQAAISIFLLEYVNYIRHYGLERESDERQTELHSWQSRKRISRWALVDLPLHPSHHLETSEPFWRLRPYESAPELVTGYFGSFWLCIIPPLWKRVMDPRIPK